MPRLTLGFGDPEMGNMPQLEYVLKGMKRLGNSGTRQQRLPITPLILELLKQTWSGLENQDDTRMLWAASTLCFFGFLRSGEVVAPGDSGFDPVHHLSFDDVSVDSHEAQQSIEVTIKASKMDPFRKGVTVVIRAPGGRLCPLAAVLGCMVSRGPGSGPLFRYSDSRPLTRARFVAAVRHALEGAGLDAKSYAGTVSE